jgi:hypothetical protein
LALATGEWSYVVPEKPAARACFESGITAIDANSLGEGWQTWQLVIQSQNASNLSPVNDLVNAATAC